MAMKYTTPTFQGKLIIDCIKLLNRECFYWKCASINREFRIVPWPSHLCDCNQRAFAIGIEWQSLGFWSIRGCPILGFTNTDDRYSRNCDISGGNHQNLAIFRADIWPKPITDNQYFIDPDFYRYL